ncbi:MAG TPA: hypothetical protein VGT78_03080 [Rhizomicrobium sp.]|nr:hypothetical protein [Rhizomicrobium sp.]
MERSGAWIGAGVNRHDNNSAAIGTNRIIDYNSNTSTDSHELLAQTEARTKLKRTREMSKGKGGKETIRPPSKKELSDASRQLKKGHSSGGRTMADASVAKREGVKRK